MKCIKCGSDMTIYDVDYNFKGNEDVYYVCKNEDCLTSCIKSIRYFQTWKEEWFLSESEPSIIKKYPIQIKKEL